MVLRPAGIIIINNDLTDSVQTAIVSQLHISEVIDGVTFDARMLADTNYSSNIKQLNLRILVKRSLQELDNRDVADLVLFATHGSISILSSGFGPPGYSYPINRVTWPQLCIFST